LSIVSPRRRLLLAGLLAIAAAGCGGANEPGGDQAAPAADASPDSRRLAAVVDAWYGRWLKLNRSTRATGRSGTMRVSATT
jgi:hypothetical protein